MKVEKCRNCIYYTAYYMRWSSCYDKLNNGSCSKFKQPQKEFDTCYCFKSNDVREKSREKQLFASLELALKSINDIALILKEKERDKEDFIS